MKPSIGLTFVGHATTLVAMDGVRLLTDPILRRFLGPLVRYGPPIRDEWRTGIDAVLLSHLHHDHCDLGSLKRLGPDTHLIVPEGAAKMLRRRGHRQVTEVTAGDSVEVGGLTVEVVPAVHTGMRSPFGPLTECVGFIARGSDAVYFAGDTDVFPEMREMRGRVDVALLPIWGWGPTLGDGHMDPLDAAQALALIRPRAAVPIHWGTFSPLGFRYLKPRYLTEPPNDFARHAAELAPGVAIRVLATGESLTWAPGADLLVADDQVEDPAHDADHERAEEG